MIISLIIINIDIESGSESLVSVPGIARTVWLKKQKDRLDDIE
ncbi:hypothetical protein CEXT_685561, partial [Caerostris extrusa]